MKRFTLVFTAFFALLTTFSIPALAEETKLEPITPKLGQGNEKVGKQLFLQCKVCHVTEKNAEPTIGPNLWGVVGRKTASTRNYVYSDALKKLDGVWDYEKLNRYLWNPEKMAPGNRMAFPGLKRMGDRVNLIAYLRTLSNNPVPLPAATETIVEIDNVESADSAQDWQGLPAGKGRAEVFYTCNACHSLMIVQQQGMSRDRWEETLEWMIEEQGMTEPSDEDWDTILDYLSTRFGE